MDQSRELWQRLTGSLLLPGLLALTLTALMYMGGIFAYRTITSIKDTKKDYHSRSIRYASDKKEKTGL